MRRQVLICDDAMFMRSVIASVLADTGFEVVGEATTGTDAVAQYKALRPDVVTMDLIMPEMGGIEAVRAIREQDPDARIVICSAMGQEHLVEQAKRAGARAFVVKPFRAEALMAAVTQALDAAPGTESAA